MTTSNAGPGADPSADRHLFLGGSDIGPLLGVDRYRTPRMVWEEKTGRAEPFMGNQHTKRGQKLEAAAAAEYTERHGLKLHRVNAPVQHELHPFLGGHVDRRVVGRNAIAEIKCPSLGMFSKIKREGLPESMIVQLQWYMGLTGATTGTWVVFCADQWDLVTFDVPFDPVLFARCVDRAVEFWVEYVEKDVPPPETAGDEAAAEIAKVGGTHRVVERPDPEFRQAMEMLAEAQRLARDAELIEEEAKARVRELIAEEPGIYTAPGCRLTLTAVAGRKTFDKAALVKAQPLDLSKSAKVLAGAIGAARAIATGAVSEAEMQTIEAEARTTLTRNAALDLGQFDKLGKGYTTMRATFYGEER